MNNNNNENIKNYNQIQIKFPSLILENNVFEKIHNKKKNITKINKLKKSKFLIEDDEDLIEENTENLSSKFTLNYSENYNYIIKFEIISEKEIYIYYENKTNIDNIDINNIFKYFGAKHYENSNHYSIPFSNYSNLLNELNNLNLNSLFIEKIPQNILNLLKDKYFTKIILDEDEEEISFLDYSSDLMNKKKLEDLPKQFLDNLYEFQKEGIQFGIDHHCRMLFGDEMGVGKTIQALALTYLFKEDWPVLIVCPASMKYSWKAEIEKWLNISKDYIQLLNKGKNSLLENKIFYITSYDLIKSISYKIRAFSFKFVILDECHYIKNYHSIRAKKLIPIITQTKRLLMLSGTPLLNNPIETFIVFKAIRPDLFYNINQFMKRYCNSNGKKIFKNGTSNTKELHLIIQCLMIRRLKKDILNQLPPKRRQKIEIDVDFEVFFEDCREKITVMDNYLKTGLSKIKGIISYLKDILLNQEKILLFAHHKLVLDAIEKMAKKNKIDYIRIDGTTPQEKRFEYINKFQNKKETLIAILSLTAASTGITLTAAKTVVFAELAWTPALLVQAEDRTHRIGQNANFVDIKYLYGRGTLDDEIFKRLEEKNLLINTTLDNHKEKFIGEKNENILFNDRTKNDVLNIDNFKDNVNVEKKNMKKNEVLKAFFNKENKNNILNKNNDNFLNEDKNDNYKIHSKFIEKDEMKSASTCLSLNKNENNISKNKIDNLCNKNIENFSLSKKEIINLHNNTNNKRRKKENFFFLNNYHKNIKYN